MRRAAPFLAVVLAALSYADAAAADDILSKEVEVRVTETAVFNYHFNNRNDTRADDFYGEWLNRLNVQATSGRFTAAVRLDSAIFVLRPNPNSLAQKDADESGLSGDARQGVVDSKTQQYGGDLSTRYRNVVYPSKAYVTYTDGGLSLTVGDTYAQLGRGLVLSMRKVDELGVDTTLRGAKADYKGEVAGIRLGATLLGGLSNPLRVDEPTGRILTMAKGGRGDWFPLMPNPHAVDPYLPIASPTFSPDRIVGGHLDAGTKVVQLGVNVAQTSRDRSPFATPFLDGNDAVASRNAGTVQIASASLSLPNLGDHGSFYVEVARQTMTDPIAARAADLDNGIAAAPGADPALLRRLSGGYAIYAVATGYAGPFTLSLEGKHYKQFFPVAASVGATEFLQLQYNAPPTTELITNDTQFGTYNVCVTGGRARLDWRADPTMLTYVSAGRYVTYSERDPSCGQAEVIDDTNHSVVLGETRAIRNDVWDTFAGFELSGEEGRSHAYSSVGVRLDDTAEAVTYPGVDAKPFATTTFYREAWLRYDLVKHLSGPFSLELAGWHRYRFEPQSSPVPWREGEFYQSLIFAPKLTFIMGYEYSTKDGTRKDYFNGLVQWRVSTDTVVRLFAGQTRPALRCVSGVCRQFPAFEGAKLELVARF